MLVKSYDFIHCLSTTSPIYALSQGCGLFCSQVNKGILISGLMLSIAFPPTWLFLMCISFSPARHSVHCQLHCLLQND